MYKSKYFNYILYIFLLIILCIPNYNVYAKGIIDSPKILQVHMAYFYDITYSGCYGDNINNILPQITTMKIKDKEIQGVIKYLNCEDLNIGYHEIQWVFTPNNSLYETKSGYIKLNIFPSGTKYFTKLPCSVVYLKINDEYKVNIINKIKGSKYYWYTIDSSIVKVDHKNGKIKALNTGATTVYCKMDIDGIHTIVLKTNVEVK